MLPWCDDCVCDVRMIHSPVSMHSEMVTAGNKTGMMRLFSMLQQSADTDQCWVWDWDEWSESKPFHTDFYTLWAMHTAVVLITDKTTGYGVCVLQMSDKGTAEKKQSGQLLAVATHSELALMLIGVLCYMRFSALQAHGSPQSQVVDSVTQTS